MLAGVELPRRRTTRAIRMKVEAGHATTPDIRGAHHVIACLLQAPAPVDQRNVRLWTLGTWLKDVRFAQLTGLM